MTYSSSIKVWSVMPTSAKLGIGAMSSACASCITRGVASPSWLIATAASRTFLSDKTLFKMLVIVAVLKLKWSWKVGRDENGILYRFMVEGCRFKQGNRIMTVC